MNKRNPEYISAPKKSDCEGQQKNTGVRKDQSCSRILIPVNRLIITTEKAGIAETIKVIQPSFYLNLLWNGRYYAFLV